MKKILVGCVMTFLLMTSCSVEKESLKMSEPPIAERRAHVATYHGMELKDPYHWLKDQSYPQIDDEDVLDYLKTENAYFEEFAGLIEDRVEDIYNELKGRLEKEDASVPYRDGDYMYQSRYVEDSQYRQHVRWSAPSDSTSPAAQFDVPEEGTEVILDQNELAEGLEYFRLGTFSVSPDYRLLAYSSDTNGSERFTLVVKDLTTGELLSDRIENTGGGLVWANDNKSFLYVMVDEHWRPSRVRHHVLGTDPANDPIVYEESDPGFFVGISRTTSREFAVIGTDDHETSEVYVIPLDDLTKTPQLIVERRDKHYYSIDHGGGDFYVLTNDTHKNFRLARTPSDSLEPENWSSVIDGSDSRYITNFQSLATRLIISYREEGLDQIAILEDDAQLQPIEFDEAVYSVGFGSSSAGPNPKQIRIFYSSLVTPSTTFDYDLATGERFTRKIQKIPSGYDASLYTSERRMARSHDGVLVPVSIVYRKDTPLDGTAPLYLRAYGAYGSSSPPSFSTTTKSWLDRGFVYAIAHIRGGSEMGYYWYEDGKLDKRMNTFLDFISVARYLIDEKFTAPKRIAITGGSAGGTLMGVVVNEAPELWGAVVSHVPFVDVLNTMLDDSLPLTPIEWPEWGNPITDSEAYEYILSYSPYDQLEAKVYPPMLVTAGLNDPRVTYWEPAKYVAKLRHLKTDDNLLFLKTEMGAGHGGRSGRYEYLRVLAETFAFVLHAMDIQED